MPDTNTDRWCSHDTAHRLMWIESGDMGATGRMTAVKEQGDGRVRRGVGVYQGF